MSTLFIHERRKSVESTASVARSRQSQPISGMVRQAGTSHPHPHPAAAAAAAAFVQCETSQASIIVARQIVTSSSGMRKSRRATNSPAEKLL